MKEGLWDDYYYPETLTAASLVDIDHLVPLKHAHMSGAQGWSKKRKLEFANDPMNLVITNKSYNRRKGAKGIHEWLPVNRGYACKYVRDWFKVKMKYGLIVKADEGGTVERLQCSK